VAVIQVNNRSKRRIAKNRQRVTVSGVIKDQSLGIVDIEDCAFK